MSGAFQRAPLVIGIKAVRPAVSRLLASCRPIAVARRIRAVVVSTLQGMQRRWPASHVSKEIGVIVPARIDFNPPASIVAVGSIVGIVTTRPHTLPQMIFPRPPSPMLLFGVSIVFSASLAMETSAGLSVFLSQIISQDNCLVPAVTATKPSAVALANIEKRKDGKAFETLSDKVKHAAIVIGRIDNV